MGEVPSGTVTLLFTDIEGSTRLLEELGPDAYGLALEEHRRLVREAFGRHGGHEVDTAADAFFVAFSVAGAALSAAAEAQAALASGPISVRMGLHTGEPIAQGSSYVGRDVHLAARVMSAGHGGQVLLTSATRKLVEGEGGSLLVYLYFVVGLLGAAMTPYEVYFYSSGVVEDRWSLKDLRLNQATAIIGYALGGFLSCG